MSQDGELLPFNDELSADPTLQLLVTIRFQAMGGLAEGFTLEALRNSRTYMGVYDQTDDAFYLCIYDDHLSYLDCRLYPQMVMESDHPYYKYLMQLPWRDRGLSNSDYNPLIHVEE